MISFNFLGIPVRIEIWFWITMVILGGGTTAQGPQDIINVAIFVFAGFLSILVHELGHALTVRKYGLPTAITLVAFGGYASHPAGVLSRRQSFLITAAGPALQIAFGLAALAVLRYLPMPEYSLLPVFLIDFVWISIVWALFNCMPIFPLDGGQMLAAIAGMRRMRAVHITGMIVAAGLGVLLFTQLGTWFLPVYMIYFVWLNWQALQQTPARSVD